MARVIILGGGVSANPRLRHQMKQRCQEEQKKLFIPQVIHCTDNAAMIALAGNHSFQAGSSVSYNKDVYCHSTL